MSQRRPPDGSASSPSVEMNPAEDTREWLNQLDLWESGVDTLAATKVKTGVDGSALAMAYDTLVGPGAPTWPTGPHDIAKGVLDFDSPPTPAPAPTVRIVPARKDGDLLAEIGDALDRALSAEVALPSESRMRSDSPELDAWLNLFLAEPPADPQDGVELSRIAFEAALISRQVADARAGSLLEAALRPVSQGASPYLPIARLGLQTLRGAAGDGMTSDPRRARYRFEQCLRFARQLAQTGVDAAEYRRIAIELETSLGISGSSPRLTLTGPNDVVERIDTALAALAQGRLDVVAEGFEAAAHQLGGRPGAALAATASLAHAFRGARPHAASARADALAMDDGNLAAGLLIALDFMIQRAGDGELAGGSSPSVGAVRAVTGLTARELRGSVLRFVGRVCDRQSDSVGAARLAGIAAAGASPSELPFEDRMVLLSGWLNEAADPLAALDAALAGSAVDGPEIAMLAAAASEVLTAMGRPDVAVGAVRRGLEACPDATFLALVAEPLGAKSGPNQEEALRLWGAGDAARRSAVQLALAESALLRGNADAFTRAANAALEHAGVKHNPTAPSTRGMGEGLFIDFAWWALHNRDVTAARSFLAQGAEMLSAAGANELAAAFRDRGELARLSERPIAAATQAIAPTLAYWVGNVLDHPRTLASTLVDPGDRQERFAARLRSASMPTRICTTRVIEAIFWMIASGDPAGALQFLQPRWHPKATPLLVALMRRLLVLDQGPEGRIAILQRLEAEAADIPQASALAFLRSETLFEARRSKDADAIMRELSLGPLRFDVASTHHALLWTRDDTDLLDASLRDEIEARVGLGRKQDAIAAIIERATALRVLRDDRDGASVLALQAAEYAGDNPGIAIQALSLAADNPKCKTQLPILAATENTPHAIDGHLITLWRASESPASGKSEAFAETYRKQPSEQHPSLAVLAGLIPTFKVDGIAKDWSRTFSKRGSVDTPLDCAILFECARQARFQGNFAEAIQMLQLAVALDDADPWSHSQLAILHHQLRQQEPTVVALRAAALRFTAMPLRAMHCFAAATLVGDGNEPLTEQLLRETLVAAPGHVGAYRMLAGILSRRNDLVEVAALMQQQAAHTQDPVARASMHLRRVDILLELGLKTESKEALRVLLTEQPKHPTALHRMGDLEFEDGAFAIAAELYLRLVGLDPDPETAKKVLRRLGRVFHRRLNDTKQAVTAYARVLTLDPENVEALSALSLLYAKQNDSKRAVEVTEKAISLESDQNRRITLLVQLAVLFEKDGDLRRAASLLGQAVGEARRSLQAVGELARFYERHRDTQSRQVLLDTTLTLVREDLVRDPASVDTLRTVVPLLRWRKRAAGSTAMAQLLVALSPDAHERNEISKWAHAPKKGRRLSSLANSELDELTNPGAHILGLRHVMRLCGPEIASLRKPDLRPFSIGRAQRVPAGRGPRTVFDPLAVDLNQKGFELYVSAEHPKAMAIEPGDPPAIIIGQAWVDAGEVALRFAAGMTLRLASTHLDLLAVGRKDEGAALLGAVIREFIPGYVTLGVEPTLVARFQTKIGRALSRSLRTELSPFITEIAGVFDPAALRVEALATGARAGLLSCGDLGTTLRVLIGSQAPSPSPNTAMPQVAGADLRPDDLDADALRKDAVAADLIAFALSSEYEMLVRALDSVS
jgi:tetratricopeptide (TPR) repeat protein